MRGRHNRRKDAKKSGGKKMKSREGPMPPRRKKRALEEGPDQSTGSRAKGIIRSSKRKVEKGGRRQVDENLGHASKGLYDGINYAAKGEPRRHRPKKKKITWDRPYLFSHMGIVFS